MADVVSPFDVYKFVCGKPLDPNDSDMITAINRELDTVPHCYRDRVATCVGWLYHMEHRFSPWNDGLRLWYTNEAYLDLRYLRQRALTGEYNLCKEEAAKLFITWSRTIK